MDFKQLTYFISIADSGSYSHTARTFFLSQSAVSRQINELENELGVKLFTRNTRKVSLTKEGEVFLEDARKMLDLQKDMFSHLQMLSQDENQSLSIAYLLSPVQTFLPEILGNYMRLYPGTHISMDRKSAGSIIESLKNNEYDIYFSNIEDFKTTLGVHTKIVQTDYYCIVASKFHPISDNHTVDYKALTNIPFVSIDPADGHHLHGQLMDICKQLGFTPKIVHYYHSIQEIVFAIRCGFGISILPAKVKEILGPDLTTILLDLPNNVLTHLAVAWHKDTTNPSVERFLQMF